MFTQTNGLILLAVASAANSCPIPEIYWRTDFIDRSIPAGASIREAVEVGLATGLLGYERERLVMSGDSRKKIIEIAKAAPPLEAAWSVAYWLSGQFPEKIRSVSFELEEGAKDDSYPYGMASISWWVRVDGAEITQLPYLK